VDGFPYSRPTYEEVKKVAAPLMKILSKVEFSSPVEYDYSGIRDIFTLNLRK